MFKICDDGSQRNLFREMTQYPFAERDDILDAAATGMSQMLSLRCEPRIWDFGESENQPSPGPSLGGRGERKVRDFAA